MKIGALLDHPWPPDENFKRTSDGARVLDKFDTLVREFGLKPVPFFTREEVDTAHAAAVRLGRQAKAAWFRITMQLVSGSEPSEAAVLKPPVARLTNRWRGALNDEMIGGDWRSPQIIVASTRRADWPSAPEILVRSGTHGDREGFVVLAALELEEYKAHPFAVSDGDPWDMRCRAHVDLPKPPSVRAPGLDQIRQQLPESGDAGDPNHYFFVPPEEWSPELIEKSEWRRGRTFTHGHTPDQRGTGPVDANGRVWLIDMTHGGHHWDVQPKDKYDRRAMDARYWRVLPDGRKHRRS